jgi:hypothetical protein
MLHSFGVLLLLNLSASAHADFPMSGPAEAKTTAEIFAAAQKDDLQGGLRKDAYVDTAEYRSRNMKAFAAWYNPYSGRADCHVYLYVHDDKKGVWVRKIAAVCRETHRLSVEFGDTIIIRDVQGEAIHRYPAK